MAGTNPTHRGRGRSVLFFLVLLLCGAALAQGELDSGSVAPPEALSAEVRGLLAPESFAVTLDGAEMGRFWFLGEVPLDASAAQVFGVHFGGLMTGQLFGAVELKRAWSDYKNDSVEPGVYTLRYARQPADGNHTGVSSYRDFLLLLPAAHDPDPGREFPEDDLNRLSGEASSAIHPAVMALFPVWDEVEKTSLVQNDLDQTTLAVKIGGQTYGLVLQGHGEIEGY